jgi:penicillin-binding protein 1C
VKNILSKTKWLTRRRAIRLSIAITALLAFYFCLPDPLFDDPYSSAVYDANGQLLSVRIARDGQWRFPDDDTLPLKVRKCLVEFEDRYFLYHPGVNAVSMLKAFACNFSAKTRRGGSTITMQIARMARDNRRRTYYEKLIETILALRIESSFSKTEILEMYAHHAPFGGNVVGIHAASWRYFGRGPEKLSWAETALLCVLPNAPSLIHPGKNEHLLIKKRDRLLSRLQQEGIIDESTYQLALQEKIPENPMSFPQLAPHLLQRISLQMGEGKIFRTTLSKTIQEQARTVLKRETAQLRENGINNACAIILDTESGNVLAYIGNVADSAKRDHNDVDVIAAPRSSGSILKPILYGFLLNESKIAPHSLIEDVPMQIGSYAPKNYNLTYDGLVPASEALVRSLNVPSVKMLQIYGVNTFLYQLRKIGFKTISKPASHYGLSLILGGAEVTPWDVASVYASMGRSLISFTKRRRYNPEDIRDANYELGHVKPHKKSGEQGLLSAGTLWTTFRCMNELARPEDYSGGSTFSSLQKLAWKTGTSFGYRDAWAVGLDRKYTIVVWVGNADGEGRPGLTGINTAAPILFALFNILPNREWFKKPEQDLAQIKVCAETGYRSTENCPNFKNIDAPVQALRSPVCNFHKLISCDSTGRYRVSSHCYPVSKMQHKSYLVLNPLQQYYYGQKHLNFSPRPPFMPDCVDESADVGFDIIYPRDGYRIYLPINETNKRNELILNATHSGKGEKLFWYLDKEFIGATSRFHQMAVDPARGKHELVVVEEGGKSAKLGFEIIDK